MEETTNNQPSQETEDLQKKCDEYLNNWKRAVADMANYKKEEMARAGMLMGYAKEGIFLSMLPIIDSIYLAAAAFGKEGFAPIQKQIEEFLKKEGIEEIKVIDQKFDPSTMEIMDEITNDQFPIPNTVVEELQKGYKIGEKVLRPAKVKVSK